MKARNYTAAVSAIIAIGAIAAPITQENAQTAANAFVTSDAIGSAILGGRTVAEITRRGALWIVALSPSGHIIFSASDLAKPIVGFSESDFTEPDPASPAYLLLEGNSERILRLEEAADTGRNSEWDTLLAPKTTKKATRAAAQTPETANIIEPFLTSHFNQWQPFNDFAPVYDSATNHAYGPAYRGRCPSGCVATAAATALHYFRWPARIDNSISYDKIKRYDYDQEKWYYMDNFVGTNGVPQNFPLRFDGHNPIDWNAICTNYIWYANSQGSVKYDLRGKVPESTRFPIARLLLWADVLAKMGFESEGSGAFYEDVRTALSDWYTAGTTITDSFERVTSYLEDGIPCHVAIDGHQVVIHGWADNGEKKYAYLNFGWGGQNDGFYNINERIDGTRPDAYVIKSIYIDHYPRAKPQLDPLPNVCSTNLTLSWHFPDIHTNHLSGFTVTAQKNATAPSDFTDNFSDSMGSSSDSEVFDVAPDCLDYTETVSLAYDGDLLRATADGSAYYTFPTIFTLTSASVLTLKLRSYYAYGSAFEIQARFNGAEWETIKTPALALNGDSGWTTEQIYLGGHGGDRVQFRLHKFKEINWGYDVAYCVLVDDFKISQVLTPEPSEPTVVGKDSRSCEVNDLASGTTYTFTVTPNFDAPLVIAGKPVVAEASAPLTIATEGELRTPIPGEMADSKQDLVFSATDTSGVWSYSFKFQTNDGTYNDPYGSVVNDATVRGLYSCSISAALPGQITASSALTFDWESKDYPVGYNNILTVSFIDADDNQTELERIVWSSGNMERTVNISLERIAGQTGTIIISCQDLNGGYTTSYNELRSPKITNVLVSTVPAVAWHTENLTALPPPEIISVSDVADGFYKGCGVDKDNGSDPTSTTGSSTASTTAPGSATSTGSSTATATATTTFFVTCSENVTALVPYSSHPSLVNVERGDVTVSVDYGAESGAGSTGTGGSTATAPTGPMRFKVCVTPRGVNESNYRSRMILTLEAIDSNGTKAYKDLSLRFDKVEEAFLPITITIDDPTSTTGSSETNIDLPVIWLEENGLVASDADNAELRSAVDADTDGDGISNWQEFLCGTNPTNATDKIQCDIEIVNGLPVVTMENTDGVRSGFRAVIKSKATLDDSSQWVDKEHNPQGPFFKVVIEKD